MEEDALQYENIRNRLKNEKEPLLLLYEQMIRLNKFGEKATLQENLKITSAMIELAEVISRD